jgi:hypothetical protein
MSDVNVGGNSKKRKFEQMTEKSFFTFSRPYLEFIDKSRIYSLVYIIMAIVNLFLPFWVLYKVIDSGLFKYAGAKYVFAFILSWFVIVFACWIGFQLWLGRRKKIISLGTSEFSATLIFSQILQTFGEWLGTLIGIIGAGAGILASIFLGNDINQLFSAIGLDFLRFGVAVVIVGPIIGFSVLILFRFLAEQFRLLASLVNNTKEIASNIKK